MMKNHFHLKQGFSLVELMVSMAIGTILILGVTVFLSDTASNAGSRAELGRVQDSGRYAASVMANDIRRAGFIGSRSDNVDANRATASTEVSRLLNSNGISIDGNVLTTTFVVPWPNNDATIRFSLSSNGRTLTTVPKGTPSVSPPLPARAAGQLVLADQNRVIIFDSPAITAGATSISLTAANALPPASIGGTVPPRLFEIRTRIYQATNGTLTVRVPPAVNGDVIANGLAQQNGLTLSQADDAPDDSTIRAVAVQIDFAGDQISDRSFESIITAQNAM